jgi:hypothetical protein
MRSHLLRAQAVRARVNAATHAAYCACAPDGSEGAQNPQKRNELAGRPTLESEPVGMLSATWRMRLSAASSGASNSSGSPTQSFSTALSTALTSKFLSASLATAVM